MITKIHYSTLPESIEDASEIYFWENAIKISPKFIEGFIEYQTEWIPKRLAHFSTGDGDLNSLIFGTSVMKGKPVVLVNKNSD